jgi:four helix bundle protein
MKSHKDLNVWKAAVQLARQIYEATADFPKAEMFGMTAQMRRCSISIASNIAEGAARQSAREFTQFIHIALGSAAELETQMTIAGEVGLMRRSVCDELDRELTRIRLMLRGLARTIKAPAA